MLQKHFGVQTPWNFTAPNMMQVVRQTKKPEPECVGNRTSSSSSDDSGSGGGSSAESDVLCFTGDAQLHLANGTTIALAHAKSGDRIWLPTGMTGPGQITAVLEHPVHKEVPVAILQT